jgi:hypothetical protein
MQNENEYDVAISYASEDVNIADIIAKRLRRDGFRCFYGPNRLHKLLGLNLSESLSSVYGHPDIVVVALISSAYLEKEWPQKEFGWAMGRAKSRAIAVKIGQIDLPAAVNNTSYVDLNTTDAERASTQISAALEGNFGVTVLDSELENTGDDDIASEVDSIAVFDRPDHPYSLKHISFKDVDDANLIDINSNEMEFENLDHYVTLGNSDLELNIGVTEEDILNSKLEVRQLIDRKSRSGWEVFNGKKFGVSRIFRSRTPETEDHLLKFHLYETDYYSSQFAKRLYRRLLSTDRLNPDYSRGMSEYCGLMRSFGFNMLLFAGVNDEPHLVLTKRSPNVANADETEGMWHVSMNEGLSLSDRFDQEFDASTTVIRGFQEELGLSRHHFSHIELFEPFMERRNFEPAIIGAAYTTVSAKRVMYLAKYASDTLLEHADLKTILATKESVLSFLESDQLRTDTLEFCLRSGLKRGLFI